MMMEKRTLACFGWCLVYVIQPCMALLRDVNVGHCHIMKGNPQAMARPTLEGEIVSSYSCVGQHDSNIHVLAMTDRPPGVPADSEFGFVDEPESRNVTVHISHLDQYKEQPIILVLASVTPVLWVVTVDDRIILDKILWSSMLYWPGMSFYVEPSPQQEKPFFLGLLPDEVANIGDGSPINRDNTTTYFLEYIRQTYDCDVASFTGTDTKVDSWTLNIRDTSKMEDEVEKDEIQPTEFSNYDEIIKSEKIFKVQAETFDIWTRNLVGVLLMILVLLIIRPLKRSAPRHIHIYNTPSPQPSSSKSYWTC